MSFVPDNMVLPFLSNPSDVRSAIATAEAALEKVKDAISRVIGYRVAIQQALSGADFASQQLEADMNSIDLPNLFR